MSSDFNKPTDVEGEPVYQQVPRYRQPPPPGPEPRRGGVGPTLFQSCLVAGCVSVVVPFALILGFFIFLAVLVGNVGDGGALEMYSGRTLNLQEKVLRKGKDGAGTIAVVTIHGAIGGNGSTLEGDGRMAWIAEQFRAVAASDDVKAVVLQVDSPGGGLTACDQLYHEVLKLKDDNKKVISWAGNSMASGGYYIAAASDGIMASPTATIGSIGVIMQHFQAEELLERIGVKVNPLTSGEHKDMGSPFREMTPEERAILLQYIEKAHARFVGIVAKGRNMEPDKAAGLADGRIYTADECVANGLADRVGYIEDALDWAQQLAGGKDMRVICYKRLFSLDDVFRNAGEGAARAAADIARSEVLAK